VDIGCKITDRGFLENKFNEYIPRVKVASVPSEKYVPIPVGGGLISRNEDA
jgi:hypothetical protein